MGGTLYLVATPIGNLQDLSPRVAATLVDVDRILAEDTRRARVLAEHVGTGVPVTSLHEHNERARIGDAISWLDAGESLALVSDAGMPLVSDPGVRLVRETVASGHDVVPIPGPSALLAALVASGLAAEHFTFLGFPPRRGGARREWLERVRDASEPVVAFESPKRLARLLLEIANACGEDRPVSVSRELTKLHEETRRGSVGELATFYEDHPPRGEVTLVVGAAKPARPETSPDGVVETIPDGAVEAARAMLAEGVRMSGVARVLTAGFNISRNGAYRLARELASEREGRTSRRGDRANEGPDCANGGGDRTDGEEDRTDKEGDEWVSSA